MTFNSPNNWFRTNINSASCTTISSCCFNDLFELEILQFVQQNDIVWFYNVYRCPTCLSIPLGLISVVITISMIKYLFNSFELCYTYIRLVQYCCTLLHKISYWSRSSAVIVLLHTALFYFNFENLWKLKFFKLFENFIILNFVEILWNFWKFWNFMKILKFYENFEILWKFWN